MLCEISFLSHLWDFSFHIHPAEHFILDQEHFSPSESNLLIVPIYCSLIHIPGARGWHQLQEKPARRWTGWAQLVCVTADKGLLCGTGQEQLSYPLWSVLSLGSLGLQCQLFPYSFVPSVPHCLLYAYSLSSLYTSVCNKMLFVSIKCFTDYWPGHNVLKGNTQ